MPTNCIKGSACSLGYFCWTRAAQHLGLRSLLLMGLTMLILLTTHRTLSGQTVTITDVTVVQGTPSDPGAAWIFTIKFKFAQESDIPETVRGYANTTFPVFPMRKKPAEGDDPDWTQATPHGDGFYRVIVDFDPVENNDSGTWIFKLYSLNPQGGSGQKSAVIDTDGMITSVF